MGKMSKEAAVFLMACMLAAGIAWAGDTPEVFELDEVVVTASRTAQPLKDLPATVEVKSKDALSAYQPMNLGPALSDVTGLDYRSYGTPGASSSISLRGANSNQVLVLMDGRILNNFIDGEVDLNSIPLDNIERIEVLKGPCSALYGTNAIGGVVNIITREKVEHAETRLTVSGSAGFKENLEAYNNSQLVRLEHSNRIDSLGLNLSGSFRNANGFRENSKYDSGNFNGNFIYDLNPETNLKLSGGWQQDKRELPGSLTYPSPDAMQKDINYYSGLAFRTGWDDFVKLKGDVSWKRDDQNYQDPDYLMDTNKNLQNVTTAWQCDLDWGGFNILSTGTNFCHDWVESSDIGKHVVDNFSLFVQDQLNYLGIMSTLFSVRFDRNSIYGNQWNPRFGLKYWLSDDWQVHASAGTAFRAPSLTALYWPKEIYSWGTYEGNPGLRPEKSWSVEGGVDSAIGFAMLQATVFYSEIRDLNVNDFDENMNYRPLNIGKSYSEGIELDFKTKSLYGFTAGVNYTFLIARDKKTENDLYYQPRNKVNSSVEYSSPWKGTYGFSVEYLDRCYDSISNLETRVLPSVVLLNCRASQNILEHIELFLAVENLTDKSYQMRYDFPMPGRTFSGGTTITF